jgi:hypothetical protein
MDLPGNVPELVQVTFYGVVSIIGTVGVYVLSGMWRSIDALNLKMGIMVEKSNWHEREIERLDRTKMDKQRNRND